MTLPKETIECWVGCGALIVLLPTIWIAYYRAKADQVQARDFCIYISYALSALLFGAVGIGAGFFSPAWIFDIAGFIKFIFLSFVVLLPPIFSSLAVSAIRKEKFSRARTLLMIATLASFSSCLILFYLGNLAKAFQDEQDARKHVSNSVQTKEYNQ